METPHKPWYENPAAVLILLIVLLVGVALLLLYTGKADLKQVLSLVQLPLTVLGSALLAVLGIKLPAAPLNISSQGGKQDVTVEAPKVAPERKSDEPAQ